MPRTIILTVVILCLIFGANIGLAQGVYVTANAGYGLGAGTQGLDVNTGFTQTTTSYEGVYGSLGEGSKFGASAGYMFSKNLGTELGFSYWLGKTFEGTQKQTNRTQSNKWSGSGFVAVPSIVVSANMKTINPYARFGLVFGILKVKEEIRIETSQITEATQEETGGLAFGYAGALGIVVPAGGTVDIFVEVGLQAFTFSPSQLELTKYTVNGVDRLPTVTDKVVKYEDSFNTGTPMVQLGVRRPFSSIGLVVGARISL